MLIGSVEHVSYTVQYVWSFLMIISLAAHFFNFFGLSGSGLSLKPEPEFSGGDYESKKLISPFIWP
jgi:hypothetical protein